MNRLHLTYQWASGLMHTSLHDLPQAMTTGVSRRVRMPPSASRLSMRRTCVPSALSFFVILVVLSCALGTNAQSFAISRIVRDNGGLFHLLYGSDTTSYYLLLQGATISNITTPSRMALGVGGVSEFRSLPGSAPTTFYRIRRIPLAQPLDTDGDGLDDVTELHSGILNPLDPT